MIVFDASVIVSAALRAGGLPERALLHAAATDRIALSAEVEREIEVVLHRPGIAKLVPLPRRARIFAVLSDGAARFFPMVRVTDCRDMKDNKYLELALASEAGIIVSGDADLRVLNPWRGTRIMTPREYADVVGITPTP